MKKLNSVKDVCDATGVSVWELEKRFWENVNRNGLDNCWEWKKSYGSHGYGQFVIGGILFTAHRLMVIIATCPIPENRLVCHKCDNRKCVNPSHLYIGTYSNNLHDAVERKRNLVGSKNGQSKLDESKVTSLREEHSDGATIHDLSVKYGVHRRTILDAISRKTWVHLN